jgi:hypothetical protein
MFILPVPSEIELAWQKIFESLTPSTVRDPERGSARTRERKMNQAVGDKISHAP